jgi:peroxiredoxin (alkyl hydroperoxide reductase subunit C)
MKKLFLSLVICVLVSGVIIAQENKIPLIGSKAPPSIFQSTNGKLTFHDDYGKSWKVLFSHPQDYTSVCSSELSELALMQGQLKKMDMKLVIISTCDVETQNQWKVYLEVIDYEDWGNQKIEFQIIDVQQTVASRKYDISLDFNSIINS